MKYAKNILETIGNTPLVKLNKVTAEIDALVLAKVTPYWQQTNIDLTIIGCTYPLTVRELNPFL